MPPFSLRRLSALLSASRWFSTHGPEIIDFSSTITLLVSWFHSCQTAWKIRVLSEYQLLPVTFPGRMLSVFGAFFASDVPSNAVFVQLLRYSNSYCIWKWLNRIALIFSSEKQIGTCYASNRFLSSRDSTRVILVDKARIVMLSRSEKDWLTGSLLFTFCNQSKLAITKQLNIISVLVASMNRFHYRTRTKTRNHFITRKKIKSNVWI